MQLRKPLSLILIVMLLFSTSVFLLPAESALAGNEPTFESSLGQEEMGDAVTFLVRIENISGDSDLATPFAPGVWVLHSEAGPIFTTGEADRGYGLEALAEDGDPAALAGSLAGMEMHAGVFNMPVGAHGPGPLLPGGAYEFEVTASPETPYLSFATMFVQSNDLFIGPDDMGIALFDMDGMAMSMEMHDVTASLLLWDAGTEANEEPGAGPNQPPRQSAADTGPADGMATVHVVDDGFSYPDVAALVKVTIEPVMMADDDMDEMGHDDEKMGDDDGMMGADAMMDEIMLMEDGNTPYTVVAGDTLGSVSRRAYGSSKYWSAICSANALENCNLIHVGDVLMLPTKAEAGAMMDKMMMDDDSMMGEKDDSMMADKDDSMMDEKDDSMMADKDDSMMDEKDDSMMADKDDSMMGEDAMMEEIMLMEDGNTPYTVVSGDTLGSISRRAYGSSKYWSVICSANGLEDCNLIHVGDELMLPSEGEAMSMMDDKMMMGEKDGMMEEKKDDMMSDKDGMMADGAMMEEIMLMEDGSTPYTVAGGDTLGSIAKRAYGESKYYSAICSANSLENCDFIQIGDELMLPTQAEADEMMDSMMMDDGMDAMDKKDDN
jgi:nucleoid-associated protein YgaU